MKFLHWLKNSIFSLLSKKTVGVRMLLIKDGSVLLIKHTYQPGWYTIGGGVDAKETPREAMERELKEEVGARLLVGPELFSVYYNCHEGCDDYVIFYIGRDCIQEAVSSPEIAEQRWFPLAQLPSDITPATKRRIDEYLGQEPINERW
jgi:8-oxo-dGTP pyrophosphatase MutT (NUDIX family)